MSASNDYDITASCRSTSSSHSKSIGDVSTTENTWLLGDEEKGGGTLAGNKTSIVEKTGVSVPMAALMFTMSLAGAAVLGVSYAVKLTGGFASIAELIFVACLTKRSTDMLIALSLDTEGVNGSYERLGHIAYGNVGRFSILVTRYVYTLTLLVVHIKVLKDNFPSAMQGIVGPDSQWLYLFEAKDIVTFITSLIVIFPMCLLRTMGLVEVTSSLKFMTVFIITSFIAYFYFCSPGTGVPVRGTTFYEDWVVVKSGVLPCLGTFVFLFVGHHCAHLAFDTLKKEHRDMHHWRQVTTLSVCITSLMCLLIGYSVYATFWNTSTAVMLQLYPATKQLNFVKIVVCIYSIFTVPMNFFAGREMIISLFPRSPKVLNDRGELEQPLEWWLLEEGQLIGPFHFALSFMQWFFMTLAAILAPTLTDILNVGGCLTGSMIGYILPCLFYFKLKGFAKEPAFLFAIGLFVGTVGTYSAVQTMLASFAHST